MRSIDSRLIGKVCVDIYGYFIIWALWALAFAIAGFAIAALFIEALRTVEQSALALITGPAQWFMFVVGIVNAAYVIQDFVRHGVTRRTYFLGAVIAGALVALSIMVLGVLLNGLSLVVAALTPFHAGRALTPYLGTSYGYIGTIAISAVRLTAYYLMGWIIGFTFYRFRRIAGFASILAGLLILSTLALIWDHGAIVSITVDGTRVPTLPAPFSLSAALGATAGILGLQLLVLYTMVRNAPIKVQ